MTFGLSRRAFAKQINCSVGWVQALVDAGRCVLTDDGKIDGEASRARIAATADPGRKDVADRHAARRQAAARAVNEALPPPSEPPASIPAGDLGVPGEGRAKAKAWLMHYENSKMKLEMELRRGLRFERDAVKREAHGLGDMLRAGVARVADQTAPRLAAAPNELAHREILDKAFRRLRWMVKRELPRSLRRMRAVSMPAKTGDLA